MYGFIPYTIVLHGTHQGIHASAQVQLQVGSGKRIESAVKRLNIAVSGIGYSDEV
jgi:hypothetical protein